MFSVLSTMLVRVALVTAVLFAIPLSLSAQTAREQNKIPYETGFYYTVQKGDTLWGISKKFFKTPFQWPDLWQKNDQLPNPHWIYPGQTLRLYLKDGVVQFEEVENIPQDAPAAEPVLPPSFEFVQIDQVGFIRKTPVEPHGTLFKSKDDKEMISMQDMVYIRPENSHELLPGKQYIVYRTIPPLEDKKSLETIGYQHYIVGIAEITGQEPGLAVGRILKAFRDIQIGDLLIPYEPKSTTIALKEAVQGLEGRLIATEEHNELIGHNTLGFIDKGAEDGVEAGQSYELFYREKARHTIQGETPEILPAIELGDFLVLHTEDTTATVLITRSDRDIKPGETFRASTR
ncbi:MAG: LysM domain-containing protein [Desulfobacterales bacterium]|jgi:LysM repeat protein|nr:LysM domain-containing protein [Desulfobacterales bacterium]